MNYDATIKQYKYDFTAFDSTKEYIANIDFGSSAPMRYASVLVVETSVDTESIANAVDAKITQSHGAGAYDGVGGGGGFGYSTQAIQTSISNAKKEILENQEEIKNEIKKGKKEIKDKLLDIEEKDIDFSEILDKIKEIPKPIQDDKKIEKQILEKVKKIEKVEKYVEKKEQKEEDEKDMMQELLKINKEVLEEIEEEEEMEEIIEILSEEILQEINN